MIGRTNAISPAGGAELVTGTIIGPSGFTPVKTLVYSDGQQALYVDVTRGSQKTIQVQKNTILSGSISDNVSGGVAISQVGENNLKVAFISDDFTMTF